MLNNAETQIQNLNSIAETNSFRPLTASIFWRLIRTNERKIHLRQKFEKLLSIRAIISFMQILRILLDYQEIYKCIFFTRKLVNEQVIMLRRNPTRIELKLDDISEYTEMREAEMKKDNKLGSLSGSSANNIPVKNKQEIIHDRIGYVPNPRPTA